MKNLKPLNPIKGTLKKNSLLLIVWIISIIMSQGNIVNGQSVKREDWSAKKAKTWLTSGDWKDGMTLKAHPSINAEEFAYQYHKNKELWDKAFDFMKNNKLDTLAPGKYVLDGENLFISVTEGPTKNFESTKWEAHKKYIDIQYIIEGKEKMGVIPVSQATIINKFDDTKDVGFFTAEEKGAKYHEATPEAFLIFFPNDAHRPSIKIEGTDSNKKLVVKIKVD